jgi:hypothetical protein
VEASEEDMCKLRLRNTIFDDEMGVYGSQLIILGEFFTRPLI